MSICCIGINFILVSSEIDADSADGHSRALRVNPSTHFRSALPETMKIHFLTITATNPLLSTDRSHVGRTPLDFFIAVNA